MESLLSPAANTLDNETLQDVSLNSNNEIRYVVTPTSTAEEHVYPNGDIYEGSFIYGSDGIIIKQGMGRMETPTRICIGNFRNDDPIGYGTLQMFDKLDEPIFDGYFHECGKRSGTLRYNDGREFTDQVKELYGIISICGTFESDLGVHVTITYDDESVYIGSTKGFQRHGKGIYKGLNGSYKGYFEYDELYYGKHLDLNQNIFEGYFVKSQSGWEYRSGSIYYNNDFDKIYHGFYSNGKRHGLGTLCKKNRIFECEYDNGKRISCCYLREGDYPNEVQRSFE